MRLVKDIFEEYVNKICYFYKSEFGIILDKNLFVINTPRSFVPIVFNPYINDNNPPYLDYLVSDNIGAMFCKLKYPPNSAIEYNNINDQYKAQYEYVFVEGGVKQRELGELDLLKYLKINLLKEKL